VLRRLAVDGGTKIVQMGYGQGGGDSWKCQRRAGRDLRRGGNGAVMTTPNRRTCSRQRSTNRARLWSSGEMMVVQPVYRIRRPHQWSAPRSDIVVAARPLSEIYLGLDVARSAAIRAQDGRSVQSRDESHRDHDALLSAEASIQLQNHAQGDMRV